MRFSAKHVVLAAVTVMTVMGAQIVKVDEGIPTYVPTKGVSGSLKSIGSDTMGSEMLGWGEAFRALYPSVKTEMQGKGSGEAPTALIAGTAQFGPMSRAMKDQEIGVFEKKFGYKPTGLPTSIDMLSVYVHKDNPLKGITMPQLDAIFSKTRKAGLEKDIKTWGDLGLTGEWADKPISLYGRNSASGTYGYFKEHALKNGDYKDTVKEMPGTTAVTAAVGGDKYAMAYSGQGGKTANVRAVPVAMKDGGDFVAAEPANAYSGTYPMARFLYLYVNYKAGTELDPLRAEFIKFVFSQQGQAVVLAEQYLPVKKPVADKALAAVGLGAVAPKPADEKPVGEKHGAAMKPAAESRRGG